MLAGHSGYDIIVPTSEPTFSRLIAAGALLPLDKSKLPNLAGEDPALLKRVATSDPGNKYGAIYLWGTIGLGEIPSKVKPRCCPTRHWTAGTCCSSRPTRRRWRLVASPCSIPRHGRDPDSVLKYLHHDPSSTDPKDLADVEKTADVHPPLHPHLRQRRRGGGDGRRADLPGAWTIPAT